MVDAMGSTKMKPYLRERMTEAGCKLARYHPIRLIDLGQLRQISVEGNELRPCRPEFTVCAIVGVTEAFRAAPGLAGSGTAEIAM